MMRHWNDIAGTLFKREVYVPLLLEEHGNDWARGFMRGMGMRHDGWAELVNDEEHGGCLIPMMMLCHEQAKLAKLSFPAATVTSVTWFRLRMKLICGRCLREYSVTSVLREYKRRQQWVEYDAAEAESGSREFAR
jgi:hypothetical protein